MVTFDLLVEAVNAVVARTGEWEPGDIAEKLDALGLDIDTARDLVHARWVAYMPDGGDLEPDALFVRAYLEGLLVGLVAARLESEA